MLYRANNKILFVFCLPNYPLSLTRIYYQYLFSPVVLKKNNLGSFLVAMIKI